jgi:hypothetical protein
MYLVVRYRESIKKGLRNFFTIATPGHPGSLRHCPGDATGLVLTIPAPACRGYRLKLRGWEGVYPAGVKELFLSVPDPDFFKTGIFREQWEQYVYILPSGTMNY